MSKQLASHLFYSEDEVEQQVQPKKSRGSSPSSSSTRREKKPQSAGGESVKEKAVLKMSKQIASHLSSSSEDEVEQQVQSRKSRGSSPPSSTTWREKRPAGGEPSHEKPKQKKKKTIVKPISACMKPTSHDLFGTDSDEQDEPVVAAQGKKIPPIYSYFTRRVANGLSRQSDETKTGKYYVELKIYNVEEIERVSPINRWRHAIITVKNRTDDRTPAWDRLKQFINETRGEFKRCPLDFVSNYY